MASPAIATMFYFSFRVAIDAPRHFHRRYTGNTIHRLYGTVTFLARETCLDVPLMRKVNIVRKIVNFNPRYRFTIFPISGQFQDLRTFANARHGIVTPHTFADAGYARHRRPLGIDVAVLARNLIIRDMYSVTEIDRLNRTAIGKIFAVYPCADKQSKHKHKHNQGWLLRGL